MVGSWFGFFGGDFEVLPIDFGRTKILFCLYPNKNKCYAVASDLGASFLY